jgi:Secretion system C-terminal sorting domain
MKHLLLLVCVVFLGARNYTQAQPCTFISPTVDILNTQQQTNGNCTIVFNLAFDVITNSGNKIIFVHLWKTPDYPSYNYNQAGNPPPTNATALSNAIVNVAIDNFGTTPILLSTYGPDNTVLIQSTLNNSAITVAKVASTTVGAERFIIKNISITVPNTVCGNSLVFTGDAWSSNSNAANAKVQCAMEGFQVGITDPIVSGVCTSTNILIPAFYSFSIATVSTTENIYYDVYLDNGNNLFEPAIDLLLSNVSIANPITITPTTPFNSGPQTYPSQIDAFNKKIFVAVSIIGKSYLVYSEIFPCVSLAPVKLSYFSAAATKNGAMLNWTTQAEQNNVGFEVEKEINGVYKSIGFIPSKALNGNSNSEINYAYNDVFASSGETIYYRLKQKDFDGQFEYSDIRKVISNKDDIKVVIFPNPTFNHKSTILIPSSFGKTDIKIYTADGKLCQTFNSKIEKRISLENLKAGYYIIKIVDTKTGIGYSERLIVQ